MKGRFRLETDNLNLNYRRIVDLSLIYYRVDVSFVFNDGLLVIVDGESRQEIELCIRHLSQRLRCVKFWEET
jgi:hypothetical protein